MHELLLAAGMTVRGDGVVVDGDGEPLGQMDELANDERTLRAFAIFTRLRSERPASYRDDLIRIYAALADEGAEQANAIVRELLPEGR